MKTIKIYLLIGFALLSMVITACTGSTTTFYQTVSQPTLKAGDPIPAPAGDVILTVTGKIGTTNDVNQILMDLAMLEAVGQVEYKVTDPFEKKDYVYRGPLVSDLLKLWRVPDDATTLSISALDDYKVDVPIKEVKDYPALFALQQDGKYMPVSTRGPAMLVFPYNNFSFKEEIYNDYWAWQIKSIDVQ